MVKTNTNNRVTVCEKSKNKYKSIYKKQTLKSLEREKEKEKKGKKLRVLGGPNRRLEFCRYQDHSEHASHIEGIREWMVSGSSINARTSEGHGRILNSKTGLSRWQ